MYVQEISQHNQNILREITETITEKEGRNQ